MDGHCHLTAARCLAIVGTLTLVVSTSAVSASGVGLDAQATPLPVQGTISRQVSDVAVLSPTDAWAVGSKRLEAGPTLTWVRHWNGKGWSSFSSPSPDAETNYLVAVDAVASDDVWAVGSAGANRSHALVEHWDGVSWSVVETPSAGRVTGLSSVSTIVADDIWAVGSRYVDGHNRALIEHWDGNAWDVVHAPKPGEHVFLAALSDVTAIAPDDVWAVGVKDYNTGGVDGIQALLEHWNGQRWKVVPGATIPETVRLQAVAGVSADDVWAVGVSQGGGGSDTTVFEHWDGSAWSQVAGPSPSRSSILKDLYASASDDVWAVGDMYDGGVKQLTEIQHWDGTSWSLVETPSRRHQRNVLNGVDGSSPTYLMAVGLAGTPLTESWDGSSWTITR